MEAYEMSIKPSLGRYTAVVEPLGNAVKLEGKWRQLEADSDCSIFLSWSWIGPWLEMVGNRAQLYIFEMRRDDAVVALSVLSLEEIQRRIFFHSKIITMNEVAAGDLDMVIEYNGLLIRRGHEKEAWQQLIHSMKKSSFKWDEIHLSNLHMQAYDAVKKIEQNQLSQIVDERRPVWSANLENIDDIEQIFHRMSKNRRWQIRRSMKEYRKRGELVVDVAQNCGDAIRYFDEMGVLHTQRWNSVGKAGSFANPEWVNFHRQVIAGNFARGEIQMLRVRCGEQAIGYIYNLIWRRRVCMLQSGFALEASNLARPGYVSHTLAMLLNAQLGNRLYDFMFGEAEYKRVLGAEQSALVSIRLQRQKAKFTVENALIYGVRKLRTIASKGMQHARLLPIQLKFLLLPIVELLAGECCLSLQEFYNFI